MCLTQFLIYKMITSWKLLREYIRCDLFRYQTKCGLDAFGRAWFTPGFRYTFFMRICQYTIKIKCIHWIFRLILRHYQFKYGISIHHTSNIGPGLYIGHFGGIIVNPNVRIGSNVNLSPNILLGQKLNKSKNKFEYPVIGDRVYIANGAKVIGGVVIGNDAIIGINTLVTHDVNEKEVVVGQPAKVISYEGSDKLVGSYL